jgi:hypothetical protein
MFWHAEGIKTEYSGTIWLDGEEYEVIPEKSYGYADKNWGGDFTSPWLWISSCNITSLITGKKLNNSAFEAGGGRPKAFGIEIPRKLLIGFYYEGTMYEYNFARFWNLVKIDFDFEEGEDVHTWHINASNKNSRMELVLYCKRDEMMLFNYEAPDGQKRHNRLWNGGNGWGEIKLYKKDGTLIDHVKKKISEDSRFKGKIDFTNKDPKTLRILFEIKKKVNKVLSQLIKADKTKFIYEDLIEDQDFILDITQKEYCDELYKDLWEKIFKKIDKVFNENKNIKKKDIDEIILVGGSSRTPGIKLKIKEYFGKDMILQDVNVDEIVAQGAAVYTNENIKITGLTKK